MTSMNHSSGQDIVSKLAARYAAFNSYQDHGTVLTQLPDREQPIEITFNTRFSRPAHFRFKFITHHPYPPLRHLKTHHIYGSDGATAYSWHKRPDGNAQMQVLKDLSIAVAGATGISIGAAHTIGRLLLPEVGGFALTQLEGLTLLDEIEFQGMACYRLTGRHPRSSEQELLIEKDTLLLRRLSHAHATGGLHMQIREDIRIDDAIDEKCFAVPEADQD